MAMILFPLLGLLFALGIFWLARKVLRDIEKNEKDEL
jgi:hypothetical protein